MGSHFIPFACQFSSVDTGSIVIQAVFLAIWTYKRWLIKLVWLKNVCFLQIPSPKPFPKVYILLVTNTLSIMWHLLLTLWYTYILIAWQHLTPLHEDKTSTCDTRLPHTRCRRNRHTLVLCTNLNFHISAFLVLKDRKHFKKFFSLVILAV